MKAAQEQGSDEKQEVAKKKEEKRLDTLDFLKSKGGPFTDEREVDDYLAMRDEQEKDKVLPVTFHCLIKDIRDAAKFFLKLGYLYILQLQQSLHHF